jgi:hypothetical protein
LDIEDEDIDDDDEWIYELSVYTGISSITCGFVIYPEKKIVFKV